MDLSQIISLVMVNKRMKFHICFKTFKVIAKVKFCHDDDNYYPNVTSDDNYNKIAELILKKTMIKVTERSPIAVFQS